MSDVFNIDAALRSYVTPQKVAINLQDGDLSPKLYTNKTYSDNIVAHGKEMLIVLPKYKNTAAMLWCAVPPSDGAAETRPFVIQRIAESVDLSEDFSYGRVMSCLAFLSSPQISTTNATLSGTVNAVVTSDIRNVVDFSNPARVLQQGITLKDSITGVALAEGTVSLSGPEITGSNLGPLEVDATTTFATTSFDYQFDAVDAKTTFDFAAPPLAFQTEGQVNIRVSGGAGTATAGDVTVTYRYAHCHWDDSSKKYLKMLSPTVVKVAVPDLARGKAATLSVSMTLEEAVGNNVANEADKNKLCLESVNVKVETASAVIDSVSIKLFDYEDNKHHAMPHIHMLDEVEDGRIVRVTGSSTHEVIPSSNMNRLVKTNAHELIPVSLTQLNIINDQFNDSQAPIKRVYAGSHYAQLVGDTNQDGIGDMTATAIDLSVDVGTDQPQTMAAVMERETEEGINSVSRARMAAPAMRLSASGLRSASSASRKMAAGGLRSASSRAHPYARGGVPSGSKGSFPWLPLVAGLAAPLLGNLLGGGANRAKQASSRRLANMSAKASAIQPGDQAKHDANQVNSGKLANMSPAGDWSDFVDDVTPDAGAKLRMAAPPVEMLARSALKVAWTVESRQFQPKEAEYKTPAEALAESKKNIKQRYATFQMQNFKRFAAQSAATVTVQDNAGVLSGSVETVFLTKYPVGSYNDQHSIVATVYRVLKAIDDKGATYRLNISEDYYKGLASSSDDVKEQTQIMLMQIAQCMIFTGANEYYLTAPMPMIFYGSSGCAAVYLMMLGLTLEDVVTGGIYVDNHPEWPSTVNLSLEAAGHLMIKAQACHQIGKKMICRPSADSDIMKAYETQPDDEDPQFLTISNCLMQGKTVSTATVIFCLDLAEVITALGFIRYSSAELPNEADLKVSQEKNNKIQQERLTYKVMPDDQRAQQVFDVTIGNQPYKVPLFDMKWWAANVDAARKAQITPEAIKARIADGAVDKLKGMAMAVINNSDTLKKKGGGKGARKSLWGADDSGVKVKDTRIGQGVTKANQNQKVQINPQNSAEIRRMAAEIKALQKQLQLSKRSIPKAEATRKSMEAKVGRKSEDTASEAEAMDDGSSEAAGYSGTKQASRANMWFVGSKPTNQ